jgi:hypothetical protein
MKKLMILFAFLFLFSAEATASPYSIVLPKDFGKKQEKKITCPIQPYIESDTLEFKSCTLNIWKDSLGKMFLTVRKNGDAANYSFSTIRKIVLAEDGRLYLTFESDNSVMELDIVEK